MAREADIVRDSDSHIKGGQEDKPVPEGFEDAVMKKDEARFLDRSYFVFRKRRLVI